MAGPNYIQAAFSRQVRKNTAPERQLLGDLDHDGTALILATAGAEAMRHLGLAAIGAWNRRNGFQMKVRTVHSLARAAAASAGIWHGKFSLKPLNSIILRGRSRLNDFSRTQSIRRLFHKERAFIGHLVIQVNFFQLRGRGDAMPKPFCYCGAGLQPCIAVLPCRVP